MDAAKPTPEQVSTLIQDWATYGIRADMLLREQAAKIESLTQELENCEPIVTPEPRVIRTTKQLATESIFAVIIWVIMIGIVSVLDLKNVI